MKKLRVLALIGMTAAMGGCMDSFLTTQPDTILTDEQVFNDPALIDGVISNFYSRLPDFLTLGGFSNWAQYDELLYSGNTGGEGPNQILEYSVGTGAGGFASWSYTLIRDINAAMDKLQAGSSPAVTAAFKERTLAEMRFQRAWIYFDMVKRMGGVPIVKTQLVYDFSGDPSYLQLPRNSEAEVYDFIAAEMDTVAPKLGNAGDATRANRYTALALKSRAMLYAASTARYGNEMANPIIKLDAAHGNAMVVGIPASRAAEYFQKSLDASKQIITSGQYALYTANSNRGENFYEVITKKAGNREAIWVKDYTASGNQVHNFTQCTIMPTLQGAACGTSLASGLSPWLQLVENFDYLDGTAGTLKGVGTGSNTAAGQANWIFYDKPEDIFANKDARLYGTVIYPGSSFRGSAAKLQAGVYVWNATTNKYDKTEGTTGSTYTPDGGMLTGQDGPRGFQANVTPTGFYNRKYLDPNASGAQTGSDVWWVRFRLGEIYMNAAEAAFELGLVPEATGYVNTLRARAGFPANSLTTLTRAKIRTERESELALEDHRVWDLKRWRTAHLIWDCGTASTTANAMALWGYRVVRPGHPNNGKYVYDVIRATRQTLPRCWRDGNYYAQIPENVINNNPQIVRNPFH